MPLLGTSSVEPAESTASAKQWHTYGLLADLQLRTPGSRYTILDEVGQRSSKLTLTTSIVAQLQYMACLIQLLATLALVIGQRETHSVETTPASFSGFFSRFLFRRKSALTTNVKCPILAPSRIHRNITTPSFFRIQPSEKIIFLAFSSCESAAVLKTTSRLSAATCFAGRFEKNTRNDPRGWVCTWDFRDDGNPADREAFGRSHGGKRRASDTLTSG